ncbi:hypothetical protein N665_7019s0001 [Sinapis alba]|nr:hypothetical protein N665_7019s0001 [Sinapis alba]
MDTATSASWRSQQSQNSYYSHQANGIGSAASYQGNEQYMTSSNPGYESWSPDHSPSRNHPNMRGQQPPSRKHDPYWNQNKRWR